MSKLYDLQELMENTRLPERTVRYYLAKVLEAPPGTRGRKAFYPPETLDKLKLAKQVLMGPYDPARGEVKPSLREFQNWLKGLSAEEISKMAGLPFSIKPKALLAAAAPQVLEVRSEDPVEYVVDQQHADQPAPWQSFKFGADIEIKVRKQLTPTQTQQLTLAGQLLRSMFGP